MISNSEVDLHVRTVPQGGYSSISNAAVRYLGTTYEVVDDGTTFGDGSLWTVTPNPSGAVHELSHAIGFIRISRWPGGLSVQVQGNGADYDGSRGMCGSWQNGGVRDRNDNPFASTDTTDWAIEWQVQASENLFNTPGAGVCTGPPDCSSNFPEPFEGTGTTTPGGGFPCGFRIGEGQDLPDHGNLRRVLPHTFMCDKTCDDIPADQPELKLNCIFDVIVSGDSRFACNPSYLDPVVIRQNECSDSSSSSESSDESKSSKAGKKRQRAIRNI